MNNTIVNLIALAVFGVFVYTTNSINKEQIMEKMKELRSEDVKNKEPIISEKVIEKQEANETGRYIPIVHSYQGNFDFRILDTKTGRVYFTNDNGERVYWDYVSGAKPSK